MEAAIHLQMQNRNRVVLLFHHRVLHHRLEVLLVHPRQSQTLGERVFHHRELHRLPEQLLRDLSQNRTTGAMACSTQVLRPEPLRCWGLIGWKLLPPTLRRLEEQGESAGRACSQVVRLPPPMTRWLGRYSPRLVFVLCCHSRPFLGTMPRRRGIPMGTYLAEISWDRPLF